MFPHAVMIAIGSMTKFLQDKNFVCESRGKIFLQVSYTILNFHDCTLFWYLLEIPPPKEEATKSPGKKRIYQIRRGNHHPSSNLRPTSLLRRLAHRRVIEWLLLFWLPSGKMMIPNLDQNQQNLHLSQNQKHVRERYLPPKMKMMKTLPLEHHRGNLR